ncbi:hypothetical protein MDAP_001905 [Mitosporidium daphniae]
MNLIGTTGFNDDGEDDVNLSEEEDPCILIENLQRQYKLLRDAKEIPTDISLHFKYEDGDGSVIMVDSSHERNDDDGNRDGSVKLSKFKQQRLENRKKQELHD